MSDCPEAENRATATADIPDVKSDEEGDDYYHVEFRDDDQFDTIRTPDWAENAAQSVSDSAEVRIGQRKESDE